MLVCDGCLYVVCGFDSNNSYLSSIERLNVAANESAWTQFTVQGLTARNAPMVCRLDDNSFIVAAGYDNTNLYDAFIVDGKA